MLATSMRRSWIHQFPKHFSVQARRLVPIRARAGYAVGPFLPYALLGGAIGRFNYGNPTLGRGKINAFNAGFLTGLGVDC